MSLPTLPGKLSQAFTIGLRPLAPDDWLDVDAELPAYLGEKAQLFVERRDEVFAAEAGTEDAQREVLTRVVAHLTERYPTIYARDGDAMRIRGVDGTVRLDGEAPALETAARLMQDDLVLMRRGPEGWRFAAGALCFPSAWRLTDKFGRVMHEVHAPVPGFGAATRPAELIARMFDALQPGAAMIRWNWSLFGDMALHHPEPSHAVPRFGSDGEKAVLRLERQTVTKLSTGDVLFAIRIYLEPIDALGQDLAGQLALQLSAMPAEQAEYKGLAAERDTLLRRLAGLTAG